MNVIFFVIYFIKYIYTISKMYFVYYKISIMKKILLFATGFLMLVSFNTKSNIEKTDEEQITLLLNNWHAAAAKADAKNYFGAMTEDAIYIGTDATEHWSKTAFQTFAKPYFDRGTAWDFKPLERHIYISKDKKTAWFDELLDTWMKVCRGSGVLVKVGNEWKIQHYVLSMTMPNDATNDAIKIKSPLENPLIEKLKAK